MAKFKFEQSSTNIEDYMDQIVTIKDVTVEEGVMSITSLILNNGEIITTTSEVIKKQALKMKEEKKLPFDAKIIRKKSKTGGMAYITFVDPEPDKE